MSVKSKYNPPQAPAAAVFAAAALLIVFIVVIFRADDSINQANLEYISSYGWQVEEKPADIAYLTIPEEFDAVFNAYNKIAGEGGFDLKSYAGTRAVRYSYTVTNHPESDSGLIRINIFICREKIVAADISSLAPGGFIKPIDYADPNHT